MKLVIYRLTGLLSKHTLIAVTFFIFISNIDVLIRILMAADVYHHREVRKICTGAEKIFFS